jgi:hypothetical protein
MGSISMKSALAVLLFSIGISNSYGQNWNEIFRQKKTQQKYLLQQIAALEVYTGNLKKGYEIVNDGLQTIKDFSNGEFNLHNAFITGLKKVSAAIRNDVRVIEIVEMHVRVNGLFNKANRMVNDANGRFSDVNGSESLASLSTYIASVRQNVMRECDSDLEELLMVIMSGKVEMGDDERIERLNKIYFSMRDKSAFTQNFISELSIYTRQKEMEKRSIEQSRNSYGIKD